MISKTNGLERMNTPHKTENIYLTKYYLIEASSLKKANNGSRLDLTRPLFFYIIAATTDSNEGNLSPQKEIPLESNKLDDNRDIVI